MSSFETIIREKDCELERAKQEIAETRRAASREQRLIMSAWYELSMRLQTNPSPDIATTPNSWLGQQRKGLDYPRFR
jgi:hypothetical protein